MPASLNVCLYSCLSLSMPATLNDCLYSCLPPLMPATLNDCLYSCLPRLCQRVDTCLSHRPRTQPLARHQRTRRCLSFNACLLSMSAPLNDFLYSCLPLMPASHRPRTHPLARHQRIRGCAAFNACLSQCLSLFMPVSIHACHSQ